MSSNTNKVLVAFLAATLTLASASALARDRHENYYDPQYDPQDEPQHDSGYEDGNADSPYDYAKVVDVQPLSTRVRVSTPQQECWNETRYDDRGAGPVPNNVVGGTLLGAVIGAAIGNQIGSGDGRRAATAGGAIIGATIGHNQAVRRTGYEPPPPREYTEQRCETRYHDEWQERIDGYRVTYVYHGRRQVTELPYRPGDRIRVRVDVSPAG
jgi:uncharacterized protein YcfJ